MIIAGIIINCVFCSIRGVFRRILPNLPFGAEIFLLVCIEVRIHRSRRSHSLDLFSLSLAFAHFALQDYSIEYWKCPVLGAHRKGQDGIPATRSFESKNQFPELSLPNAIDRFFRNLSVTLCIQKRITHVTTMNRKAFQESTTYSFLWFGVFVRRIMGQ